MLSNNEMLNLIDEIIEYGEKLRNYKDMNDIVAKRNPAPETILLDKFKNNYSVELPPSYLRLLTICNGVENLDWLDVSLLSIEFILKYDALDDVWVDAGFFEKGELFVFALSEDWSKSVAFLKNSARDDGEMEVIRLDVGRGVLDQHENLEKYLLNRRDWFTDNIALEAADREGFADED